MKLKDKNIGFVLTGSFCTFEKTKEQIYKRWFKNTNDLIDLHNLLFYINNKIKDIKDKII